LMEIVQREAERLGGLLKQILEFAKPKPLHKRPVELVHLIEEVGALFKLQVPEGVRMSFELEEGLVCEADADALHQVLWNLWRNAVDAAKSGVQNAGVGEVKTQAKRAGERVILQVSDTGPGVSEAQRERLFEPFFTTKSGGTGLGLATVHQLVSEHGGEIALVSSAQGQGACFRVSLPTTQGAQAA
jgi:signal transduction histidine kinase